MARSTDLKIRDKDLRKALREAKKQGWTVEQSKRHMKLRGPEGQVMTFPCSGSDGYRGTRNTIAEMRRAGVDI